MYTVEPILVNTILAFYIRYIQQVIGNLSRYDIRTFKPFRRTVAYSKVLLIYSCIVYSLSLSHIIIYIFSKYLPNPAYIGTASF